MWEYRNDYVKIPAYILIIMILLFHLQSTVPTDH